MHLALRESVFTKVVQYFSIFIIFINLLSFDTVIRYKVVHIYPRNIFRSLCAFVDIQGHVQFIPLFILKWFISLAVINNVTVCLFSSPLSPLQHYICTTTYTYKAGMWAHKHTLKCTQTYNTIWCLDIQSIVSAHHTIGICFKSFLYSTQLGYNQL